MSQPSASQSSSAAPNPDHPWLIMLFLAGDNDLTEDMVLTLKDLGEEGPPPGDTIVAQLDPSGGGLLTQRYVFKKANGSGNLDVFETQPEMNTGNTATLTSFIRWAHTNYGGEGKKYLLVLAGHGSGITEDFLVRDDSSGDSLTIDELAQALNSAQRVIGKKIDILGLDACFMAMGEVGYQIRGSVDILIGAEGLEPAFGWPYRRILAKAKAYRADQKNKGQAMPPRVLAEAIVEAYIEHYSDFDIAVGRSADLAALDLTEMHLLADPVANLADSLMKAEKAGQHDLVTLAHWYAQTFKADQFVDLRDFCVQAEEKFKGHGGNGVPDACGKVLELLNGGEGSCIIKSGCTGFAHQYSYGLSIYFPWAFVSPDYLQLQFARDTRWAEFLKLHVESTRRKPRFQPRKKNDESIERDVEVLAKVPLVQLLRQAPNYRDEIAADPSKFRTITLEEIRELVRQADIPPGDRRRELYRRIQRGIGTRIRYTGVGSRYTGVGSRYTGVGSRYQGEGTRFPADREKSVKNLGGGGGVAYWPDNGRQALVTHPAVAVASPTTFSGATVVSAGTKRRWPRVTWSWLARKLGRDAVSSRAGNRQ